MRNYAAEMRALIDEETSHGEYTSAKVAMQIVEKLMVNDPALLQGWLNDQAVQLIRQAINLRDASRRTHARVTASRGVFAKAAVEAAEGNTEPLTRFLDTRYVTDSDGTRKRLADMRSDDLDFAADGYGRRAKDALMQQAFLRTLARKIGNYEVKDHFGEEDLAMLWRSIGT